MRTPQRPLRADARRNHERILTAARETFTESGPEASLNEIARRAGVGPGTLYRHFPTRNALLTAVLMDRVERLCAQAEHLLATASPAEALAEWLHAFLVHASTGHGLGSALMTADPADDCHRAIEQALASLLTRAQRSAAARPDLTPDDLLKLVTGIALATRTTTDPAQPTRMLALVLDATR
ncbi:TetR/AcrR family transcriptional regulator [Spirillospora sp. CA-294931]|uniref:TetR/AcrR family transcriptional regulator n=1 Tax=Spirillospora sp. CA-294931 TaxID=3240042 RepID=UPI003D8CDC2D